MSNRSGKKVDFNVADSGSASTNSRIVVRCEHNVPCVLKTSGTYTNPGRQFYGCPYWKDRKKTCRFFQWVESNDDETGSWTNEMGSIKNLEESLMLAERKAEKMKKENECLAEELSRLMLAHEVMAIRVKRLDDDVRIIRYMLIGAVFMNAILVVVLWRPESGM
ncbi:unnamed protein product [Linum trigynum]|uniref:GRF-type domain-containing protein n=1 Tax=Linum trigynum TaxID=586398 RepID=A0AAV2F4F8_9ROSI